MATKFKRIITYHPNNKNPDEKGFPKEVGTLFMDEELAELMDRKEYRLGINLNMFPGTYFNVYPDRKKDDDGDSGPF